MKIKTQEKNNNYLTAKRLFKKNKWKATQSFLEKALQERGNNTSKIYHLLGLSYYHQDCFQSAVKYLQKACQIKSDPEYLLNLCIVLNDLGRYTEGQEAYEQALHRQNKNGEQHWKNDLAEQHFYTAKLYLKNEQFRMALEEYLKALNLQPQNILEHIQFTRILWKLGQKKQAIEHLQNIVSYSPQIAEAHLLLATWQTEYKIPSTSVENKTLKYNFI